MSRRRKESATKEVDQIQKSQVVKKRKSVFCSTVSLSLYCWNFLDFQAQLHIFLDARIFPKILEKRRTFVETSTTSTYSMETILKKVTISDHTEHSVHVRHAIREQFGGALCQFPIPGTRKNRRYGKRIQESSMKNVRVVSISFTYSKSDALHWRMSIIGYVRFTIV